MSVRVRIAPSPTGAPHVGTAYIALMNWCFARANGGQFILRIEDTDRKRSTPEAQTKILEALSWLGLDWDEGPQCPDGPSDNASGHRGDHGPYIQSERVAAGIYQQYAEQLIDQGDAYYCFATAEELAELRQQQEANGEPLGYDRRYRDYPLEEAKKRIAAGEARVVRMKAPLEGEHTYKDRLRKNPIVKPWADIDDQVLLKADGWPTYHLASVIDDHLMGITHIIRAEEWLNSLPKHTWLYAKLGWEAPEFLHVGLLRNADKSKISKRKNPTDISWFKRQGYLPEALLNFLALLGHSHPDGNEIFDRDELVRIFTLDRLSARGPVFDTAKLDFLQGHYLRELDNAALIAEVHRCLDERLPDLIDIARQRMTFGGDATWVLDSIFRREVAPHADDLAGKWGKEAAQAGLKKVIQALKKSMKRHDFSWTTESIEPLLKSIAETNDYKVRDLFLTVRIATTGRKDSPPLGPVLAELGPLAVLQRLDAAVVKLRSA